MKKNKILSTMLACFISFGVFVASACKNNKPDNSLGSSVDTSAGEDIVLQETGHYMVKNGKSDYKIVLSSNAGEQLLTAGDEMQYFLKESLGVELEIVYDKGLKFNSTSTYISIGDNDLASVAGVSCSEADYGVSGYVIRTVGKSVFLVGGGDYGSQFAVYDFLEQTLNYALYALDEVHIDKREELKLYNFNYSFKPPFEYQDLAFAEMAWWSGLDHRFHQSEAYIDSAYAAHSSFMYFPVAEYAEAHADWYNANFSQMCYSSETLVDALAEKFIADLQKYSVEAAKGSKTLNFGMEDNDDWCRCSKCSKTIQKYGSASATMVLFINKVADKVQVWIDENQPGREVYFGVMSYHATVSPPVTVDANTGEVTWVDDEIICRDNVAVRYAPISAAFMYPLNDKEHNLSTYLELKGWGAICKHLYIWSYAANFSHSFVALDVYNSIQENYRFYQECNVTALYEQAVSFSRGATAFMDFRQYMLYSWAWDVERNFKDIKNDFFNAYYKEAAQPLMKFFDELRLHYQFLAEEFDINGGVYEDMYVQEMWSQGTLEKWQGYIEEAFALIEPLKMTEPEKYQKLYDRINLESIQIRFLLIQLYSTKAFTVSELYEEQKRFFEDCEKYNIVPGETGNLETLKQSWGFA